MKLFAWLTLLTWPLVGFSDSSQEVQTIIIKAKKPSKKANVILDEKPLTNSSLADHFRENSNVNIVQTGAAGQMTSVFSRGTEARHTKLVIKEIGIADPSTPDGAMDFGHFSLTELENIEFLPGPQTVLYGEGAIGGVVRLRSESELAPRLVLGLGEGKAQHISGQYEFSPLKRTKLQVQAERQEHELQSSLNPERFNSSEKETRRFTAMNLGFVQGFSSDTHAKIKLGFKIDEVGLDDFPFNGVNVPLDDPTRTLTTDQVSLDMRFEHTSFAKKAKHQWIYRRDSFKRTDEDVPDNSQETLSIDTFEGEQITFANRTNISWSKSQETKLGIERIELRDQGSSSDTNVKELEGLSIFTKHFFASPLINTDIGVRYTDREDIDAQAYELAFHRQFFDQLTSRLYLAQGFKLPSLFHLNSKNFGNPNLAKERSQTWGMSLSNLWSSNHQTKLEYYSTDISNLIDFDSTNFRYLNRGSAKINGWEISQMGSLLNQYYYKISGSLLEAKSKETGARLARRPEFMVSAEGHMKFTDKQKLGLNFSRTGPAKDSSLKLASYNLVGASYSYQFEKDMQLSVLANNLLDEVYEPAFGYQGQRRLVIAYLKWSPN